MTEGLPELIAKQLRDDMTRAIDQWSRYGPVSTVPAGTQSLVRVWRDEVERLLAALREASRPQEAAEHEGGCPANGGYGHGKEECICKASRLASPLARIITPTQDRYVPEGSDRIIAVCRDGSWIEETPAGNRMHSSFPGAASPPATQETIVDFLRTRAKSHHAIGEADGEIRADECEALADELEAHPLGTSPPAQDSLETRFVDTFTELARSQRALDPADAKVLYDNLWSLYDDSDPNEPNITLAASPPETAPAPIPDISTTDLDYAANLIENRIPAEGDAFKSLMRGRVNRIRNLNVWLSKYGPYGTLAAHGSRPTGRPETP